MVSWLSTPRSLLSSSRRRRFCRRSHAVVLFVSVFWFMSSSAISSHLARPHQLPLPCTFPTWLPSHLRFIASPRLSFLSSPFTVMLSDHAFYYFISSLLSLLRILLPSSLKFSSFSPVLPPYTFAFVSVLAYMHTHIYTYMPGVAYMTWSL